MADHFYGIDMGGNFGSGTVTTGETTTGKKVELRVEEGVAGNTKLEVLKAIEKIKAHIQTNDVVV